MGRCSSPEEGVRKSVVLVIEKVRRLSRLQFLSIHPLNESIYAYFHRTKLPLYRYLMPSDFRGQGLLSNEPTKLRVQLASHR
jgi:hypothetical protein